MSTQKHLQILNTTREQSNQGSQFTIFPLLITELRLEIWKFSLQRERLIRVRLDTRSDEHDAGAADATGGDTARRSYSAVVDGHQVLSKLLRVNRESRAAALEFYRVHLPCNLTTRTAERNETTKPGTFYFNPEYDFLQITPEFPVELTILNFLYHLKNTYDRRGVGLLNLALEANDLVAHQLFNPDAYPDRTVIGAFKDTIMQLREIFFLTRTGAGRQVFGLLSGTFISETHVNRSIPIHAMNPTFERLPRDTRPISTDLRKVHVGLADPRQLVGLWHQLLEKWGIPPLKAECSFLLSFVPTFLRRIFHKEDAEFFLEEEDIEWKRHLKLLPRESGLPEHETSGTPFGSLRHHWPPLCDSPEKYRNEYLGVPAFGFWLFPCDTFGPLPGADSAREGDEQAPPAVIAHDGLANLEAHWPILALSNLS